MRLICLSDHQDLLKTYCELWYQAKIEQDEAAGKKPKEEWVAACEREWHAAGTNDREIFLFQKNGDFVGYAEVCLEEKCTPIDDLAARNALLVYFYILPQFRRHKMGATFFKLIRQWAREKEAAFIEAELQDQNVAAHKFFQSQGMELLGKGVEDRYRIVV